MNIKTKLGGAVLTGALALGTIGALSGAQAQDRRAKPAPQKSIKPGQPDITLECCRCVGGGEQKPIDISTGVAKWTVSKTPTPPPPPVSGGYTTETVGIVPTNMAPQVAPGNIGPNPLPGIWATLPGADWLQPALNIPGTQYNGTVPNGHWTYVLKVQVPNCTVPQKVVIDGQIAADDAARLYVKHGMTGPEQVLVGGPTVTANFAADGSSTRSFNAVLNPSMPGGFTKPGTYFIRVELDNLGGAPAGVVLKGSLAGKCSDSLIRHTPKDKKEAEAEQVTADCPDC